MGFPLWTLSAVLNSSTSVSHCLVCFMYFDVWFESFRDSCSSSFWRANTSETLFIVSDKRRFLCWALWRLTLGSSVPWDCLLTDWLLGRLLSVIDLYGFLLWMFTWAGVTCWEQIVPLCLFRSACACWWFLNNWDNDGSDILLTGTLVFGKSPVSQIWRAWRQADQGENRHIADPRFPISLSIRSRSSP